VAKLDLAKFKSGGKHTVKVTLNFETNGHNSTEQIKVIYRGISLEEGEALEVKFQAMENKRQALIELLAQTVIELPDISDNGQPVAPTAEFFATLDTYYLNRINQAIQDDRSGNA
jgi:hypothetical protein